jgi:hypothetical protein
VLRRCPLGLHQRVQHWLDLAQPVHLSTAHLDVRHPGKGAHLRGVALDAPFHSLPGGGFLVTGTTSGQHQRGGHALQVPFEGSADGLIEVVDVEDQSAVGRGISTQVAHMRVAAELADDAC